MVRATAALLLLLRDAEAAYIAVVGPTGDDVIVTDLTPVRLQLNDDESRGFRCIIPNSIARRSIDASYRDGGHCRHKR